jgi:DNA-binding beta-propeller fold protein YncE
LVVRSDSQRLYALGNAVVSTLDITATAGPDSLIDAGITAPGATYMLYDSNLNRLYIPGGAQLTMLDVSQSKPSLIGATPIGIPTIQPTSRTSGDPCGATSAATLNAVAVTALPDGSRAYVGSFYEDASHNICPQVTVIDAVRNSIKSTIAIPGFPALDTFCSASRFRLMMAAAGDSTRAYLSSCDGGNVNIIDTSTDTYVVGLPAPVGSRFQNPPQNPVFLIAGP